MAVRVAGDCCKNSHHGCSQRVKGGNEESRSGLAAKETRFLNRNRPLASNGVMHSSSMSEYYSPPRMRMNSYALVRGHEKLIAKSKLERKLLERMVNGYLIA